MSPTIVTSLIPSWLIGLLRALGIVIVLAAVQFLGNAADLAPFLSTGTATAVASLVGISEEVYKQQTGSALFGAFDKKSTA